MFWDCRLFDVAFHRRGVGSEANPLFKVVVDRVVASEQIVSKEEIISIFGILLEPQETFIRVSNGRVSLKEVVPRLDLQPEVLYKN